MTPRPARAPPESEDEIGFLSKSFNAMSARIANLMRETENAHQREKEHEIRALQAQIDPHFLSNTLDTINWIARERSEQKISRMLTALSRILQYSISDGRPVTWRDEIQWLTNYVFLQQTRYESRLEVRYDIDPRVLDLATIHLLLQPFVENAIEHGFRARQGEGTIVIRGALENGCVSMEISDNGCGITEAKIDEIFSGKLKDNGGPEGIGIFNVHERIRLRYGPPFGVTLTQRPQGGTLVRISFPAIGKE